MRGQDVDRLREAIAAEAERQRKRVLEDAESQAEQTLSRAKSEAENDAAQIVDAARSKADRMTVETTGAARLEAQTLRFRRREAVLDDVFDAALERVSDPEQIADYGAVVEALVTDAVARLSGNHELVIHADPTAQDLLDEDRLARMSRETACALSVGDPLGRGNGVVVASPDGRLRYDNTFGARLERMKANLRTDVYRILTGDKS
jgi:vacuolar-type H+-ATPase subunit E/Vma4